MSELVDIATIIGIISTIVGLICVAIKVERRLGKMESYAEIRFGNVESRIQTLESKIEPFWGLIKNNLPRLLSQNPNKQILTKLKRTETLSITELVDVEEKLQREMEIAPLNRRANFLLVISYLQSIRKGRENDDNSTIRKRI